ncbi:MAG: hypothetical protein K8L97_21300 [Anaerolineae bacterium]|nr:hypothetical protein [Anaerolineae bacterium]
MQQTRRYILDILKEQGEATVDDLVENLRQRRGDTITAVTVRHHLNELLKDSLITNAQSRHRTAPGRPKHIYVLTEQSKECFPNNYQPLATGLLAQICTQLPPKEVNVILEGVANHMASQANVPDIPLVNRMDIVVNYLNEHGYNARWEKDTEGYILRTSNCPYHFIAQTNHALCEMDMRLVAALLGVVPRLMSRMSTGDASCAYMIPLQANN